MKKNLTIKETDLNIISVESTIQGTVKFQSLARIHGTVYGDLLGMPGSQIILSETSIVEGNVSADQIIIEGFVKGDIQALTSIRLTATARIIGNLISPKLFIEPGAYFEGTSKMEHLHSKPTHQPLKQL